MKRSIFIFFALLVFLTENSFGQNQMIALGGALGNSLKIYSDFPETSNGFGLDAVWMRQGDTNHIWEKIWNYPEAGIALTYTNLGNADTLGSAVGLMYRFQLLQSLGRRWSITEGIDLGFAYYNKPFNITENPGNIAIGARFGILLRINFTIRFLVAHRWQLFTGFSFHHASNSHTGLPNVGINIPMLTFGTVYYLKKIELNKDKPKPVFEYNKHIRFNMRLALGINRLGSEIGPPNGPYYQVYLASFYLDKRVSAINNLQLGIDAYYNSGYRQYLESQQPTQPEANFVNASVISIWVGNEFLIGRLGLIFQIGYNIHNPFLKYLVNQEDVVKNAKAYLPTRIGVQYYLKDHFHGARSNAFIGLYTKANMGQADFFEMSLGVKF